MTATRAALDSSGDISDETMALVPMGGVVIVDGEIVPAEAQEAQEAAEDAALFPPGWLANQRSQRTVTEYAADWREFITWCREHGAQRFNDVGLEMLAQYARWLRESGNSRTGGGLSNASVNRKLSAVRQGLTYAQMAGMLEKNWATLIRGPRVSQLSPRVPLSNVQVRAILSQPDRTSVLGARDYAMLLLGFVEGLRRMEIVSLTCDCLYVERSHIVLRVEIAKGDEPRVVAVQPAVAEAIRAYLALDGRANAPEETPRAPLFRPTTNNRWGGSTAQALRDQAPWRAVLKYARAAGIANHPHLDAHTMRVTAATNALDNGASLTQVQDLLGHKDPKTTGRYVRHREKLDNSAAYRVNYD